MDAATIEALREALDDEFKARATCRKVIETFGRAGGGWRAEGPS